jgi:uncharacterized protein (TIGR03905 family)
MTFTYLPKGTCSTKMDFTIEDNIIKDFKVTRGCDGNLKGIKSLIIGMDVNEVIEKLEGIRCGLKSTSCPDQIAQGLKAYLNK